MDIDPIPDPSNEEDKHADADVDVHAMKLNGATATASSGSLSLSLPPSFVGSNTLQPAVSLNSNGISPVLEPFRRQTYLDLSSLPRVHSTGRSAETLSTKESRPDLVKNESTPTRQIHQHHRPYIDHSKSEDLDLRRIHHTENFEENVNLSQNKSYPLTPLKNEADSSTVLSHHPPSKLNAPADKLRPYSPGHITVVKEGGPSPSLVHEADSTTNYLNSIEKEFEDSQHGSEDMAPDYNFLNSSKETNGVLTDCHCGVKLEHTLQSAVRENIHWLDQAMNFGALPSQIQQLSAQLELAHSKCSRLEMETESSARTAVNFRTRVHELEMELAARDASLHGLKAKVAQQFVDSAELIEQRRQFERDNKDLLSQLDSVSKSERWYRERLHEVQTERAATQQEAMSARERLVLETRRADRLHSDLVRAQDELREGSERAVREKQALARQLETALAKRAQPPAPPASPPVNGNVSKSYVDEHVVEELQQRVSDLQHSLTASARSLSGAHTENERLLTRSLQLQRELAEARTKLQLEQERSMSAEEDRDSAQNALKERERALSQLSGEHAALAVQLDSARRERTDLDEAVSALNKNFASVSSQCRARKAELQALEQACEAARQEARTLRGERDVLAARLEEGGRREQAARLQLSTLESAASPASRGAQLEHEVLALREKLERARADSVALQDARERAMHLGTVVADLTEQNQQLRARVEGLSDLLQANTGSKLPGAVGGAGRGDDARQLQQLRADNLQLQAQLQGSVARMEELTHIIEGLEGEMKHLKERGEERERVRGTGGQGEGEGHLPTPQHQQAEAEGEALMRAKIDSLEETCASARAQAAALQRDLEQLRAQNATLVRARHELTERVEELNSWLDAVTQGEAAGARYEARERVLERLSVSPVLLMESDPDPDRLQTPAHRARRDVTLQAFVDANKELALFADALQRRLDRLERPDLAAGPGPSTPSGSAEPRPDLLSSAEPRTLDGNAPEDGVRCMLALLQACLHRAKSLSASPSGKEAPEQLQREDDDTLDGVKSEVQRLVGVLANIERHISTYASRVVAEVPEVPEDVFSSLPATASNSDLEQRLRTMQREHKDKSKRHWDIVRALLIQVKEHAKAQKTAEQKLAELQSAGSAAAAAAGDARAQSDLQLQEKMVALEQELASSQSAVTELNKQLFAEKRDNWQLRKDVASLRMGLDTANDMLDNNKIALGRSESYGQLLKVSKEQLEARLEAEQREHEECRVRLEQTASELVEARAKDPVLAAQLKALGCHLHQRTEELRTLQERLELRDRDCADLRLQLERQRCASRKEHEDLQNELQKVRQEFSTLLTEMSTAVPKPTPCDEEGLSALMRQSRQMSAHVFDDLENLLQNLKADIAAMGVENNKHHLVQHV